MTMDVKGVPWVGAMCQRFEALCVEVDETIYEDTVKYVGNQMRTVGETVKKFYSEVMHDLLAQSLLDSAEDKDTLVAVSCNDDAANSAKPKIDYETQSLNAASEGMVKESAAAAKNTVNNGRDSEHNYLSDLTSSSASVMKDSCEESTCSGAWSEWNEDFGCDDLISEEASAVEEGQSKKNREKIIGYIMEGNASAVIIGGRAEVISVRDAYAEKCDSVLVIEPAVESTVTNDVQNCLELNENITVSDAGASNALLAHEIRRGVAHTQGVHLTEQCNNFKLEESCVLVENKEHLSKSSLEDVQKSYKKKIREVFFPRRWSKSKKDQEQLAAWYEEQCGKSSVSTSIRHDKSPKSSETFESEWELL